MKFNFSHMPNVEDVLVIMNGPDAANLNIDQINSEILKGSLIVIVTNGALSNLNLIDHKNVIYFINDELLEYLFCKNIENPMTESETIIIKNKFGLDDKTIEAMWYDVESLKTLRKSKKYSIALESRNKISFFEKNRVISFDRLTIIDKILYKISYKWGQDGRDPKDFLNKYGLKLFPNESRLFKLLSNSKKVVSIWYELVLRQTPNTFYFALDLAGNLNSKKILFIGRNSQIDQWLELKNKDNNGKIVCNYNYFFSKNSIQIDIKKYSYILREVLFSCQYVELFKKRWNVEIFCLSDTMPYKDFYNKRVSDKYMLKDGA